MWNLYFCINDQGWLVCAKVSLRLMKDELNRFFRASSEARDQRGEKQMTKWRSILIGSRFLGKAE